MQETLTIAHISDLHFSVGASRNGNHSHSVIRLEGIAKILNERPYDLLVVSGDLTNRGDKDSLLQAKEYIYHDFGVSSSERTGLRSSPDKTIIIPGNHDAYDCVSYQGSPVDHWQKSLSNYNEIFQEHQYEPPVGAKYKWIEKSGRGVFIVSVDSCYLGDPLIEREPDLINKAITRISSIARGKLSCNQSEEILTWFDHGMKGILQRNSMSEENIDAEMFRNSLKILVMHHYLFEPPKYKDDLFMKVDHRNTVFRNLAMADFDIVLCGHKHVSDFGRHKYGDHFDKRAKGRYLLNLFRRLIGIYTLPMQIKDDKGRNYGKALTLLLALLLTKSKKNKNLSHDDQYLDDLMNALHEALDDPTSLDSLIKEVIQDHNLEDVSAITDEELREIKRRMRDELTMEQRKELNRTAKRINGFVKKLGSRTFLQIMAGSAAKESGPSAEERSFNVYSIDIGEGSYRVKVDRYIWDNIKKCFRDIPESDVEEFPDSYRVMF